MSLEKIDINVTVYNHAQFSFSSFSIALFDDNQWNLPIDEQTIYARHWASDPQHDVVYESDYDLLSSSCPLTIECAIDGVLLNGQSRLGCIIAWHATGDPSIQIVSGELDPSSLAFALPNDAASMLWGSVDSHLPGIEFLDNGNTLSKIALTRLLRPPQGTTTHLGVSITLDRSNTQFDIHIGSNRSCSESQNSQVSVLDRSLVTLGNGTNVTRASVVPISVEKPSFEE
jgi:hypothetical protein